MSGLGGGELGEDRTGEDGPGEDGTGADGLGADGPAEEGFAGDGLVGVVLAAGRGARAGGPKALARDRAGRSLADMHVRALFEAGARDVVLVVRAEVARELRPELPHMTHVVVSDAPEEDGPAGSLRVAHAMLRALAPEVVVISPVDKRPALPRLVDALRAAVARGSSAARPVHAGRGGHPIALRPSLLAAFAPDEEPPPLLRDVLRALGEGPTGLADVPAEEDVLEDLDDAEALRRALFYQGALAGPTRLSSTDP